MVIEATGQFRSGDGGRKHITRGGARKVVISVSADKPDAFLILGANHESYDAARHDVVSPASCGVNALTVMAKVLLDRFGLRSVNTSVVLAIQGWQKVHDGLIGTSRNDPASAGRPTKASFRTTMWSVTWCPGGTQTTAAGGVKVRGSTTSGASRTGCSILPAWSATAGRSRPSDPGTPAGASSDVARA